MKPRFYLNRAHSALKSLLIGTWELDGLRRTDVIIGGACGGLGPAPGMETTQGSKAAGSCHDLHDLGIFISSKPIRLASAGPPEKSPGTGRSMLAIGLDRQSDSHSSQASRLQSAALAD
jgi:hypothetical protein